MQHYSYRFESKGGGGRGKSRHVIQASTVIDSNLREVKGVSSDEAMLRNGAVLQAVKCWLESSRSFLSWFRQPFHPPTQKTGFSYLNPFRLSLFSSFSTYIRLPFSARSLRIAFPSRTCRAHLCIIRNVVGSVASLAPSIDTRRISSPNKLSSDFRGKYNLQNHVVKSLVSPWLCAFVPLSGTETLWI